MKGNYGKLSRAQYQDVKSWEAMLYFQEISQQETRYCKNHLGAYWGKRKDGKWFDKCSRGFKEKEECEVGI